MKFNNEQYRAVTHRDGPMLVLAGPGSGKTAVIVGRVLHLIENEGIDPGSILVLTFSRAAADQMSRRFRSEADETYPVTFGTFHSIFYHILKSQGLYRSGEILTNKKKTEILKRILGRTGAGIFEDPAGLSRMTECISIKKMGINRLLDELNDDEKACLELIFEPYLRQCREEGLLDFDDMINDCLKMLKSNDKILEKWRSRYKYFLVDEFQDIDSRQYEVLRLLAGKEQNIFCVGDDDQSIYSFRGSVPDVMKRLKDDLLDLSVLKLVYNYRCPQEIVDTAYKLISNNKNRFDKRQSCINEAKKDCVTYRLVHTAEEEAGFCLSVLNEISVRMKKDGSKKETTGILYRISQSGDIIEESLRKNGIPYVRKDSREGFYDKEWVKDITAYLRLAVTDSREAMLRILNRPFRGLTRECMTGEIADRRAMLEYYRGDDESVRILSRLFKDMDFIRDLNCYAALNYILKGMGMYRYIGERYFKNRKTDLEEAIEDITDRSRTYTGIREWLDAIDSKETKAGDNADNNRERDESIYLMTIHGSKGLEFDNVFISGLQEGVFPGKHCVTADAMEEERRLFYVAMTRCRKHLFLVGRRKDSYGKRESRFLAEAGFKDDII